jgi:hypothetical protein
MIYIIISLLIFLILLKLFFSIQQEDFTIDNKKYVLLTNESPVIIEYDKLKKIYPKISPYEKIDKVDQKYILRENIIDDSCSCKNFVDINKYQDLINKVNFTENSYKDQIFNISQREQDLTNKFENYMLKSGDRNNIIRELEVRVAKLEREKMNVQKETDKAAKEADKFSNELNQKYPPQQVEKMSEVADKLNKLNVQNMSLADITKLNPKDFKI